MDGGRVNKASAKPLPRSADLQRLRRAIEAHRAGRRSDLQLRSVRVPMGVYEQRETGRFMARVCLPGGVLTGPQLAVLAEVAQRFGSGRLHVTTRQDVQVHDLPLSGVLPSLERLAEAGLSTRGGGGNTVRNSTSCERAGTCPDEIFDVTPWAGALQRALTRDTGLGLLPRKFKLAISGCDSDCAGATVADLGLVATQQGGVPGFRVYVGGGLGTGSRLADELWTFVPPERVEPIARAVRDLFDRHGDRKDKHRARLRFVVQRLGIERFRRLVMDQLRQGAEGPVAASGRSAAVQPAGPAPDPALPASWSRHCLRPQRQPGEHEVLLGLPLGDLDSDTARGLAALLSEHPRWELRSTMRQNLVLRGVRTADLGAAHASLAPLGLARAVPSVLRDMVACAGASTCKLGLCRSRGAAVAIAERLSKASLPLAGLGELHIAVSGCPNSCSRHAVADIGLFGAARRLGGDLVPHYQLRLGGGVGVGRARLAAGRWILPARRVPQVVQGLLEAFAAFGPQRGFAEFCSTAAPQVADGLVLALAPEPEAALACDWGSSEPFSLAGRGPGECGAGVIDLIDVDLESAAEALAAGRWLESAELAARALLVTRGEEPEDGGQSLELFRRHFVGTGLVGADRAACLLRAMEASGGRRALLDRTDAELLLETVRALYEGMDARLEFRPVAASAPVAEAAPEEDSAAFRDLRGVVCPLNYVKTKLVLARLAPGQVLAVLLDAEGARKVPESAGRDGHAVLSVAEGEQGWLVRIRKAAPAARARA